MLLLIVDHVNMIEDYAFAGAGARGGLRALYESLRGSLHFVSFASASSLLTYYCRVVAHLCCATRSFFRHGGAENPFILLILTAKVVRLAFLTQNVYSNT